VILDKKSDTMRLQSALTDKYELREDIEFGERGSEVVTLKKGARLLPMGSMRHCDLKHKSHLEKMNEMRLPAHFAFGLRKKRFTHQELEHMHNLYLEKMRWVGSFVTQIVDSIDKFFLEVEEDLLMSSTMESLMPSPPPVSHLYLKHCMGREVSKDAATPRSYYSASDDDDDEALAQKTENCSMPRRIERNHVLNKKFNHSTTAAL